MCPSVIVGGLRTPPRLATAGVIATAEVDEAPDLAYAQDSAIFPAPTVQPVPTLVQGGLVQVVLALDVASHSALDVAWGFSKITGLSPLDSRLARCEALPNASGAFSLPAPPSLGVANAPGHFQLLVTYVFQGPFAGLHLSVTEQGVGVVTWSVTTIPLATVCPEIVDPSCPT